MENRQRQIDMTVGAIMTQLNIIDFTDIELFARGEERSGVLLKADCPLTNDEKQFLYNTYDNVEFYVLQSQYAPELIKTGIFVF